MNMYQASERDQRKAERIRRQYIPREENKMEQLRKLDGRVKLPGKVTGGILGGIGALVMGYGMALVMVSGIMTAGIAAGIAGMAAALAAYPLCAAITNRRKKKYAAEIMRLSGDVVQNGR